MPFRDIIGLHVTHKWCDVDQLERASFGDAESALSRLIQHRPIEECVILETCNRVEIYAYAKNKYEGRQALLNFAERGMDLDLEKSIKFTSGEETLVHLLRVAAGIDSMVVGEDEILGQVKDAYELAKKRGTVHKFLDLAFTKAVNVGKKARNQTDINRGSVSVGTAGVEMAEKVLGSLAGKRVLVIGAGDMATTVVKCLAERGLEHIVVANRTLSRAQSLAQQVGGEGVKFSKFTDFLSDADLVISATGAPHPILEKDDLEGVNGDDKLLVLDISNPRDVAPGVEELEGIERIDLDGLEEVTRKNRARRESEAEKVEDLIKRELDLLIGGFKEELVDDLIGRLHRQASELRRNEFRKAINKLEEEEELSERQKRVIGDMSRAIMGSMLANPTEEIKRAAREGDEEFLTAVKRLFSLEDQVLIDEAGHIQA